MPNKKRELLWFVVQRLGAQHVAARLKVDEDTLTSWLAGNADMAHNKALALADLVSELTLPLKPLK